MIRQKRFEVFMGLIHEIKINQAEFFRWVHIYVFTDTVVCPVLQGLLEDIWQTAGFRQAGDVLQGYGQVSPVVHTHTQKYQCEEVHLPYRMSSTNNDSI